MRGAISILAAALWAAGALPTSATPAPPATPVDLAAWPQWGGPARDGTSPATGVFGGGPIRLREVWRRPAEGGIAALAVSGDRLFSLASSGGNDSVFALDAATGKEVWRVPLGPTPSGMEFGAPNTPATDGQLVFVLSPACRLLALAVETGKVIWQHDLKAEHNTGSNVCWAAPLLAENRVVLLINGEPDRRVLAFDRATGALSWSSPGVGKSVRNSPALIEIGGTRQVVVHDYQAGKGGLYGVRLTDGALLWSIRFAEAESFGNDTPLPLPGERIGIITWNDFKAVAIHAKGEGLAADPAWATRDIRAEVQPGTFHAVARGGYLYGFGGELLACVDAATGKTVWKEKIYPGSLLLVDGHLVVLSQSAGLLRVIEATPQGYREKVRQEVFAPGSSADTPPSFAGRRIYLRNSEQMVALEVLREEK
jgi:outer membrane protein assembly factor BamB